LFCSQQVRLQQPDNDCSNSILVSEVKHQNVTGLMSKCANASLHEEVLSCVREMASQMHQIRAFEGVG
jgi:hypothetical protein